MTAPVPSDGRRTTRRLATSLLVAVLLALVAGCATTANVADRHVFGIIVDVTGQASGVATTFSLRESSGAIVEFAVSSDPLDRAEFAMPHLLGHRDSGVPIDVGYQVEGDRMVADWIADRP